MARINKFFSEFIFVLLDESRQLKRGGSYAKAQNDATAVTPK